MGTSAAPPVEALRSRLLAWYDAARRDLPWRASRTGGPPDTYAVLVSEAMLQQTRVGTVVPYFLRWMRRFPTVGALAAAGEDDVVAAWSGLGYYRRARALHAAARTIVEEHGGTVPLDVEALLALPGVGPYTAGAVASIAGGQAVPAVDGNVVRVLCRLDAVQEDPSRSPVRRALEGRAAALVDPRRPGDWNQALMDLGATVCTPRAPRCGACPWAGPCRGRAEGAAEALPRAAPKRRRREEEVRLAVVRHEGRLLMVRPSTGLLAGTWRLPGGPAGADLAACVAEQAGVRVELGDGFGEARHVFTHRAWTMRVHAGRPIAPGPAGAGAAWIDEDALHRHGVSTAMRKALAVAPR